MLEYFIADCYSHLCGCGWCTSMLEIWLWVYTNLMWMRFVTEYSWLRIQSSGCSFDIYLYIYRIVLFKFMLWTLTCVLNSFIVCSVLARLPLSWRNGTSYLWMRSINPHYVTYIKHTEIYFSAICVFFDFSFILRFHSNNKLWMRYPFGFDFLLSKAFWFLWHFQYAKLHRIYRSLALIFASRIIAQ